MTAKRAPVTMRMLDQAGARFISRATTTIRKENEIRGMLSEALSGDPASLNHRSRK
jgi:hypothetical protein